MHFPLSRDNNYKPKCEVFANLKKTDSWPRFSFRLKRKRGIFFGSLEKPRRIQRQRHFFPLQSMAAIYNFCFCCCCFLLYCRCHCCFCAVDMILSLWVSIFSANYFFISQEHFADVNCCSFVSLLDSPHHADTDALAAAAVNAAASCVCRSTLQECIDLKNQCFPQEPRPRWNGGCKNWLELCLSKIMAGYAGFLVGVLKGSCMRYRLCRSSPIKAVCCQMNSENRELLCVNHTGLLSV